MDYAKALEGFTSRSNEYRTKIRVCPGITSLAGWDMLGFENKMLVHYELLTLLATSLALLSTL
jgi:hypothetical protein